MDSVAVAVTIDTEEDNWGAYGSEGATTENIRHLPELQRLFERRGVRPTYLVNRPPLVDPGAVAVLRGLVARDGVEIGAHCHPWNTPPLASAGIEHSMMFRLSTEENRAKIRGITDLIVSELGVRPITFRAGRWGFGPTVAAALVEEGFQIDCSVTPFIDWSDSDGPDFSAAPISPYRFDPADPLKPTPGGRLLQLPPTIGFLRGRQRMSARIRTRLESSWLSRRKVVGLLDSMGMLQRRWLSPETSGAQTMIRLAQSWVASGERFVQVALHSCALLPGATPFVRSESDRSRFLDDLDRFFDFCTGSGFRYATLQEAAAIFSGPETPRRPRTLA